MTPAPAPTPTPTSTPLPTPSPTPTSIVNNGAISFLIQDSHGNPLNNTLVSSITQPTGTQTLIQITNATGYVTFQNVTTGSYTFKVLSAGYAQLNETINYGGEPLTLTLPLVNSEVPGNNTSNNFLNVIIAVATIVIAAVVICLVLLKRKTSPNAQKLKDLKKQMNYKKEP